jgi:hypothetical protein
VTEREPTPKPSSKPIPGVTPERAQRARLGFLRTFGWLAIFGIGAAMGAILGAFDVAGWIIGVVVSALTLSLGFVLRRSLAG